MLRNVWRNSWRNRPNTTAFTLAFTIAALVSFFATQFMSARRDAKFAEMHQQTQAEIAAEYERRQALKSEEVETELAIPSTVEDPGIPAETTEDPLTEALPTDVIPQDADTNNVQRVISGPYKGLTIAEFNEIRDWDRRQKAYQERRRTYWKKFNTHAAASLASSKRQTALMLESWTHLSPEQLEFARQEALKTQPADKVDAFFNAVKQHTSTRTHEELDREFQELLKSRETQELLDRELMLEWEALKREYDELQRTRPPKRHPWKTTAVD